MTCAGEAFAARVAASLLTAIGLQDLVTTSLDDYEDLAALLATDGARLAAARRRLADSEAMAPLFDTARFARRLETGYERILARRRAHLPPDHIAC